jgi:hypothetical protein
MKKRTEILFGPEEMPDAIIDRISLDLVLGALNTQVEAASNGPGERMSSLDRVDPDALT